MTNWIISSSLLIVLIMLVRLVFKERMSQRLCYSLWLLVLVRLLVPFSLGETEVSIDNITEKAVQSEGGQLISEVGRINLPKMSYSAAYDEVAKEYAQKGIDIEDISFNEYAEKVSYEIQNKRRSDISIAEMFRYIWLGGIAIVGGCFVGSNLIFASKLAKNRRVIAYENSRLPVYVTDKIDTPCLFGIFRPAVYVTDETINDSTALHHVVEHELTHFRHGDYIWALLRGVCLAIHWYNPLVWAAAVMSKNDAELACDEATIKRIGENQRADYGRTLIMMTCEKRPALLNTATTMTGSGKTIKERISLIVKKPKMAAYTLVIVAVLGIIAALVTFTGADKGGQNFYEWTSSLTASDIETATVSKYFGIEQRRYTIPEEDYQGLVNIFNGIKAKDLSNDKPQSENTDGYMLALYRDGKLWLFKALADGSVGLMFDTPETGAIYDCEGSLLRIKSETLWNYIVKVADEHGELDTDNMTAAQRIQNLEENEIKRVESIPIISGIEPSAHALYPLLKKAAENPVESAEDFKAYWNIIIHFMNDNESIILSAGLPENCVLFSWQGGLNDEYDLSSSLANTGESFFVNDEALYDYVRNTFHANDSVSDEVFQHRDILNRYAEEFMNKNAGLENAGINLFRYHSEWDKGDSLYMVYEWDIAFQVSDPLALQLTDDVWIDSDMRLHGCMKDNIFVVYTKGDTVEYRFLTYDINHERYGLDWGYIAAVFGDVSDNPMIELAYTEALGHAENITLENSHTINIGNGMYNIEFPVAGTNSYVKVTLIREKAHSWSIYDSKVSEYGAAIDDRIVLAYEEALTRSTKITIDDAQGYDAGNGLYVVEFPIRNTDTYVEVTLMRETDNSYRVYCSEVVSYGLMLTTRQQALTRMSNLTAGDIKYISSNFEPPSAEEMASAMANAVKNAISSEPDNGVYFWSADVYVSGGPSGFSSNDEHFNLYAGPTENIVAAWYKPEGDGDAVRLCFEDADLYRLIRDIYQTYVHLDRNALEPYRDIIEARAQKTIDESKNAVGVQPYTGYEIVRFDHIDEFERSGASYNVYAWDVAFTADDPVRAGFAGGMWVDNKLRIRSVDEEVYFIVRDDGEYRFMFWDLYTDVERAPINIEKAFE